MPSRTWRILALTRSGFTWPPEWPPGPFEAFELIFGQPTPPRRRLGPARHLAATPDYDEISGRREGLEHRRRMALSDLGEPELLMLAERVDDIAPDHVGPIQRDPVLLDCRVNERLDPFPVALRRTVRNYAAAARARFRPGGSKVKGESKKP